MSDKWCFVLQPYSLITPLETSAPQVAYIWPDVAADISIKRSHTPDASVGVTSALWMEWHHADVEQQLKTRRTQNNKNTWYQNEQEPWASTALTSKVVVTCWWFNPNLVIVAFLCEIKKQDRMFIHLPFFLLLPHLHRSNEDEEEKAKMAHRWTEPHPWLGLSLSRPEGRRSLHSVLNIPKSCWDYKLRVSVNVNSNDIFLSNHFKTCILCFCDKSSVKTKAFIYLLRHISKSCSC